MKNLALVLVLLVGATAGGCALLLSPMFFVSPSSIGGMGLTWAGLTGLAALAIWGSFRLWPGAGWRLGLLWAALLLAGGGGWLLFLRIAFRGFN